MTQNKAQADEAVEDASAWWRSLAAGDRAAGLGEDRLAVEIRWQQPYYRVRLGNFQTQAEAARALERIRGRFPEAFSVPDQVTVYK